MREQICLGQVCTASHLVVKLIHTYSPIPKHITVSQLFVSVICPNCSLHELYPLSQTKPLVFTRINILFLCPLAMCYTQVIHPTLHTRELTWQSVMNNCGYNFHKHSFTLLYILGQCPPKWKHNTLYLLSFFLPFNLPVYLLLILGCVPLCFHRAIKTILRKKITRGGYKKTELKAYFLFLSLFCHI